MSNAKHIRREILEINTASLSINSVDLEEKVCEALSMTGTKVKLGDLEVCDRMKKKDRVVIKLQNRKQTKNVIFKQKEFKPKEENLLAL